MRKHPIARILKERGISQHEFGQELGISQAHVSLILKGRRRLSIDKALVLSDKYGIPVKEFFR